MYIAICANTPHLATGITARPECPLERDLLISHTYRIREALEGKRNAGAAG